MADALRVDGTGGATAVVFSPENSALTSAFTVDVATLAVIHSSSFAQVAAFADSEFVGGTAQQMMSAMETQPDGVLVNTALAEGLKLETGDDAKLILAPGDDQQTRKPVRVIGFFIQFPGAPEHTDIVANLGLYEQATGLAGADYYLVSAVARTDSGLTSAVAALSDCESFSRDFVLQTSAATLRAAVGLLVGIEMAS